MSESSRDILAHGIAAAKANSKNEARYFLEWLLRDETADDDERDQARHYLVKISDEPKVKRDWLEDILARNPMDAEARRELAILKGDLNTSDIINPDDPLAPPKPAIPPEARRFVCPNCGGRMTYNTADASLTCEYCGNHQSILEIDTSAFIEEQNFIVALATAKGHSTPTETSVIQCAGCGATFQFAPTLLSRNCPYCGTPYALEHQATREIIAPEGIAPFTITRERAHQIALEWYQKNKFKILSADALPNGAYLPIWTFDVGGVIDWSCVIEKNDRLFPESGTALADENDLLVSASHTLSPALTQEIESMPAAQLVPYDARYIADYAAETYQLSVSDASLVARARALLRSQPRIRASITQKFSHLQFSTLKMVIDSYKLVLMPYWIARYRFEGKWFSVIIHGQTGQVFGEKPARGIGGWFSNLMKV